MTVQTSPLSTSYSPKGVPTYTMELWHEGLNKHRVLRAKDQGSVTLKAQLLTAEWQSKWEVEQARAEQRDARAASRISREDGRAEAAYQTEEAAEVLSALDRLLLTAVASQPAQPWQWLMEDLEFTEHEPAMQTLPALPVPERAAWEPVLSDKMYQPEPSWLDFLQRARKLREVERRAQMYKRDRAEWEAGERLRWARHAQALEEYETKAQELRDAHALEVAKWQQRRDEHHALVHQTNEDAHIRKRAYEAGESDAVVWFCENVLYDSEMPDGFPCTAQAQYLGDSKTAVINLDLPAPEAMPRLKSVRYVATLGEYEEQFLTESQAMKQMTTSCTKLHFVQCTRFLPRTPQTLST
jgi:restriction system protein